MICRFEYAICIFSGQFWNPSEIWPSNTYEKTGGRTLDPSVWPEEMVQKMSKEELKQRLGGEKGPNLEMAGVPKFINHWLVDISRKLIDYQYINIFVYKDGGGMVQ